MNDLAHITHGPITGLSAAYLARCWRDGCVERVDPDDGLGLCAAHLDELTAASLPSGV